MKFGVVCSFYGIVTLHIDVVLMQEMWHIFSVAETIKCVVSVDCKQRLPSFFNCVTVYCRPDIGISICICYLRY
jgi:hypothetical protein